MQPDTGRPKPRPVEPKREYVETEPPAPSFEETNPTPEGECCASGSCEVCKPWRYN